MNRIEELTEKAIDLLKQLIETPSFSGKEQHTASHIAKWLEAASDGACPTPNIDKLRKNGVNFT